MNDSQNQKSQKYNDKRVGILYLMCIHYDDCIDRIIIPVQQPRQKQKYLWPQRCAINEAMLG